MRFKLLSLIAVVTLGLGSMYLGMKSADAQVPLCIPVSPLSTTCAPQQVVRILCPNHALPYMPYSQQSPFVGYYGNIGYPIYSGLYYGYNSPIAVVLDPVTLNVVNTFVLPDSRLCNQVAATPTPVPTTAPATTVQTVIREVQVPVSQPAAPRTSTVIRPPSTGDGGLANNGCPAHNGSSQIGSCGNGNQPPPK